MNKHTNRAFSVIEIIIVLFVVILIGAVAWVYFNNYNKAAKPTVQPTTNQDSKTDTNNTTGSASTIKYKTFEITKSGHKFTFEYPDNWTVSITPVTDNFGNEIPAKLLPNEIKNEKGVLLAIFGGAGQGLGGWGEDVNWKVLDSEKTNYGKGFNFIYSNELSEGNAGYGLYSWKQQGSSFASPPNVLYQVMNTGLIGTVPEEEAYEYELRVIFADALTPSLKFDSEEAAKNYMNTDEYKQIKRMIMSLKY